MFLLNYTGEQTLQLPGLPRKRITTGTLTIDLQEPHFG